jgi:mono/diheme cytochrome c family protein
MFYRPATLFALVPLWVPQFVSTSVAAQDQKPPHPIIVGFERFHTKADTPSDPGGRLLLTELGCLACHQPNPETAKHLHPNPPLVLDGVASRIHVDYLKEFIADPQSTKPGTTMPNLFVAWPPPQKQMAVDALTHYFASLSSPIQKQSDSLNPDDIKTGDHLYHTVGCVACHAPNHDPAPGSADENLDEDNQTQIDLPQPAIPSVPRGRLRAKTSLGPLATFLLDPLKTRPAGRMPNMKLKPDEARRIAAYLLNHADNPTNKTTEFKIDSAKADMGKIFFRGLGCAACHQITQNGKRIPSKLEPFQLHQLDVNADTGCLGSEPIMGVPNFSFSPKQRTALKAAIANLQKSPFVTSQKEKIQHTLAALNCYACHDRDRLGGPEPGRAVHFAPVVEADLGDEGRFPPTLTAVGSKLQTQWLQKMMTGTGDVRPFMATRMPIYGPDNVAHLPPAFAAVDKDPNPLPTDISGLLHHHRNSYGRHLLGTNGLSCITCHGLKRNRSLGIPATDLAVVPHRLRPEWFKKYLLNPATLRPGTRMPAFFENRKSAVQDVLKGNADQQIEAIWIYLKELDQTRLPVGMESKEHFELIPKDRPIIHRTFMKSIGAHAITVGHPQSIHFAFDALNVKLAMIWRGRYINAESAWSDRFTPFIDPLSDDRFTAPPSMPFAVLPADDAPWPETLGSAAGYQFRGYRLDTAGNPTFLYQFREWHIEDQLTPAPDGKSLNRILTIKGPESPLWFLPTAPNEKPQSLNWQNQSATVEETFSW